MSNTTRSTSRALNVEHAQGRADIAQRLVAVSLTARAGDSVAIEAELRSIEAAIRGGEAGIPPESVSFFAEGIRCCRERIVAGDREYVQSMTATGAVLVSRQMRSADACLDVIEGGGQPTRRRCKPPALRVLEGGAS